MKVLVTGGCGFLGSNLTAFYLEQGAEVVVSDALFRSGGEENLAWLRRCAPQPERLHFVRADLADAVAVDSTFQKFGPFDFVFHVGG